MPQKDPEPARACAGPTLCNSTDTTTRSNKPSWHAICAALATRGGGNGRRGGNSKRSPLSRAGRAGSNPAPGHSLSIPVLASRGAYKGGFHPKSPEHSGAEPGRFDPSAECPGNLLCSRGALAFKDQIGPKFGAEELRKATISVQQGLRLGVRVLRGSCNGRLNIARVGRSGNGSFSRRRMTN